MAHRVRAAQLPRLQQAPRPSHKDERLNLNEARRKANDHAGETENCDVADLQLARLHKGSVCYARWNMVVSRTGECVVAVAKQSGQGAGSKSD